MGGVWDERGTADIAIRIHKDGFVASRTGIVGKKIWAHDLPQTDEFWPAGFLIRIKNPAITDRRRL
jgi:hypothetical protein